MIVVDQPSTVKHSQVVELIRAMGFDVKQLRSLRIDTQGVWATVFAQNDKGDALLTEDRQSVATHEVFIRIVHD